MFGIDFTEDGEVLDARARCCCPRSSRGTRCARTSCWPPGWPSLAGGEGAGESESTPVPTRSRRPRGRPAYRRPEESGRMSELPPRSRGRDRADRGELHLLHALRPRVPGLVHPHRLAPGDRARRPGGGRDRTRNVLDRFAIDYVAVHVLLDLHRGLPVRGAALEPRAGHARRPTCATSRTRRTGCATGCGPCRRRPSSTSTPSRPRRSPPPSGRPSRPVGERGRGALPRRGRPALAPPGPRRCSAAAAEPCWSAASLWPMAAASDGVSVRGSARTGPTCGDRPVVGAGVAVLPGRWAAGRSAVVGELHREVVVLRP